ncbi:MAG: dual specificity protein phosphatase family protein [Myxococcales bacterium]|nr:dual specificity protein phosphatase family protein [Myxococcales bacterium]
MGGSDRLDHHLVHGHPHPLYMGELPGRWETVPSAVVVNLCGVYPSGDPDGRLVFGFPLLDVLDRSISPSRETLEAFLASVHDEAGGQPSYWHCHAGLNRSGLAVAAYLHLYRGMRISDAIASLRRKRSEMVLCNHLFEGLLREWYGGPDEQEFQRFNLQTYLKEREGRR